MCYRKPFSQNLASIRKSTSISGGPACILQDDVEISRCFHEALVLDDVRVLWTTRNTVNRRSIKSSGSGSGIVRAREPASSLFFGCCFIHKEKAN